MKVLQNQIKVYVPSSKLHFIEREFESQLVAAVGGFTREGVFGGWRGHDGTVVREHVIAYAIYYKDEDAGLLAEVVFDAVFQLLRSEEAVLIETPVGEGAIVYATADVADTQRDIYAIVVPE